MKIAIISPNITSQSLSEKIYNSQQLNIAKVLIENNLDVEIFTCKTDERNGVQNISLGNELSVKVHYLPYISFKYQEFLPSIHNSILDYKPDLLISSEDYQLLTLQVAIISKLLNIPLVIFQGAYTYLSTKKILNFVWKLYDKTFGILVRNSTSIVIAKTGDAEKYMKNKGYKNVIRIPVGIDLTTFKSEDNSFKKEIDIDVPIILYVGSYTITKNIGLLLRAFSIVSSKLEARLLLVGYNELPNELNETIKEYNITNKVIVLSKVQNKKMPYIYSSADLLVLPSKKEIFGMVILEAMACGIPVISTPIPAAKDLIIDGENGFIISEPNPNKLAELMFNILNNDVLKGSIGKNARETMEKNCDWNQIAKQYIEIFDKLLNETHEK